MNDCARTAGVHRSITGTNVPVEHSSYIPVSVGLNKPTQLGNMTDGVFVSGTVSVNDAIGKTQIKG